MRTIMWQKASWYSIDAIVSARVVLLANDPVLSKVNLACHL